MWLALPFLRWAQGVVAVPSWVHAPAGFERLPCIILRRPRVGAAADGVEVFLAAPGPSISAVTAGVGEAAPAAAICWGLRLGAGLEWSWSV